MQSNPAARFNSDAHRSLPLSVVVLRALPHHGVRTKIFGRTFAPLTAPLHMRSSAKHVALGRPRGSREAIVAACCVADRLLKTLFFF